MGLNAHEDIGGLDADHQVVIALLFNGADFLQGTFHQRFGGYAAVFFQKLLLQGTAVDADPDGNAVLLCLIHHGPYPLSGADISRINPDLVGPAFDGRDGQPVIKMNIGHQRDMNLLFYFPDGSGRFHGGNGNPDNITARRLQLQNLLHCFFHMLCFCVAHGLNQHRISSADFFISNLHYPGLFSVHTTPSV